MLFLTSFLCHFEQESSRPRSWGSKDGNGGRESGNSGDDDDDDDDAVGGGGVVVWKIGFVNPLHCMSSIGALSVSLSLFPSLSPKKALICCKEEIVASPAQM